MSPIPMPVPIAATRVEPTDDNARCDQDRPRSEIGAAMTVWTAVETFAATISRIGGRDGGQGGNGRERGQQ